MSYFASSFSRMLFIVIASAFVIAVRLYEPIRLAVDAVFDFVVAPDGRAAFLRHHPLAFAGMTPHDAEVQRRNMGLNAITSRLLDTQRLRWRRE